MFTVDLVILYSLFFLLGSVFTTIILSHFYEIKAVEEEEKSVNNRGDQTNGLSVIKNLSTKRFFKGIASIALLILLIVFFILTDKYELFKHDKLIAYIVLGVFLVYVLFIERTIIYSRIPIITIWKKGAPKRAEKRQKRKEKRLAKREFRKQKREAEEAQRRFEEKQQKEGQ
jgi:ABC-type multidrug transport system fused ATPase/permease subunit